MASITHLAAGAVCGAMYARATSTRPAAPVVAFAALGLSPDVDFFFARWGSAGTPFEHRVMTHSLPFAVAVGVLLGSTLARRSRRLLASVLAVAALASHGLLDAMTSNGPGPRLFWPLTDAEIRFPWRPIPGTRFYQDYFTPAAVPILAVEALWCLPFLAAAVWVLTRSPSVVERWRDRLLPGTVPDASHD